MSDLSSEFDTEFVKQGVPPLTKLLANISSSRSAPPTSTTTIQPNRTAGKPDKHFFASVVQDKNLLPLYREVVTWMLKRDLLVTLHLRVRVFATPEIKEVVRLLREKKREQKGMEANRWEGIIRRGEAMDKVRGKERRQETPLDRMVNLKDNKLLKAKIQAHQASDDEDDILGRFSDHGHPSALSNRRPSSTSRRSNLIPPVIYEEGRSPSSEEIEDDDSASMWVGEDDDSGVASIILNPGQATPLQRKWLEAMSADKDELIARRFEKYAGLIPLHFVPCCKTNIRCANRAAPIIEFINILMGKQQMTRYCTKRRSVDGSCASYCINMMNTSVPSFTFASIGRT